MPPTKLIGNITDPEGIKNGKYKEVPNSNFFNSSSNSDNWNISIKFNLDRFNNTLQSIIGNMQNNGWGLWITPQRKLQWKIGSSSYDLDNFGELKDNTLYQIDVSYSNGNYTFSLINLDTNKAVEKFNIVEFFNTVNPAPIVIRAGPITTNSGSITLGGDTNNKFLGSISDIKSYERVEPTTMPTTMQTTMSTTMPPTTQSTATGQFTTTMPTTMPPTAMRFTTMPPTTMPPTTMPPTTMPPTTMPPTTNQIPVNFIVRDAGDTIWRQQIESGDQTLNRAQGWNPDEQTIGLNIAPHNQIARQFRYFAEYWLNRSGRNEGSARVITYGNTYHGMYTFKKREGGGYNGKFYGYDWNW
jgi:hypothetical protein